MVAELDLRRCKFIDESGVNISMTRLYGRAPRGERAVGSAPQNYGENVTMLGSLSASGLEALMTVNGATDSLVFRAYVSEFQAFAVKVMKLYTWSGKLRLAGGMESPLGAFDPNVFDPAVFQTGLI